MTLTILAVIFGVFAIALILLLIYNSTLTMHRDDQLFLDDASSHMHEEQTELLAKLNGAQSSHGRISRPPPASHKSAAQASRCSKRASQDVDTMPSRSSLNAS